MERFLPIINRENCCKVWLKDVICIVTDGRRVKIATAEEDFFLYGKVSDFNRYLVGDKRFYQCTKGFILNLDKVDSMKDQIIYFENGMQYMLGRGTYLKVKQRFANYMRLRTKK